MNTLFNKPEHDHLHLVDKAKAIAFRDVQYVS